MEKIELYFDGYCPESLLNGKQVEMKLNDDDFWESVETKLQISVFYPYYATILRWRGKGNLKSSSENASDVLTGLVLANAMKEKGKEIFPDKYGIICNKADLALYLNEIFENKETYNEANFNPIKKQEIYLLKLDSKDFAPLFESYNQLKAKGYVQGFRTSTEFRNLFNIINNLKLIFSFDWTSWGIGKENINNKDFNYKTTSILELSMYITTIFRADRFSDGTVDEMFKNGTMDKIFEALKYHFKD